MRSFLVLELLMVSNHLIFCAHRTICWAFDNSSFVAFAPCAELGQPAYRATLHYWFNLASLQLCFPIDKVGTNCHLCELQDFISKKTYVYVQFFTHKLVTKKTSIFLFLQLLFILYNIIYCFYHSLQQMISSILSQPVATVTAIYQTKIIFIDLALSFSSCIKKYSTIKLNLTIEFVPK